MTQGAQKFCSQCGSQLQPGAQFCSTCGLAVPDSSGSIFNATLSITNSNTKSVGVAATLAIVLALFGMAGIGHIYLGRVGRGVAILISDWVLSISAIVFFFGGFFVSAFFVLAALLALASFALFIWQIFDASNLANQWNRKVQTTGQKPW